MRHKVRLLIASAMVASLASVFVGAASADPSSNTTVCNATNQYCITTANNYVVHKDVPNPMPLTIETNQTANQVVCNVYFREGGLASQLQTIGPYTSITVNWGTGFPATKKSTYTFDLYCGPDSLQMSLQATVTGKVNTAPAGV
jgi:hypothetical protein